MRHRPVETAGTSLEKILKEMHDKNRDIDGSAILRTDGLVIASVLAEKLDRDLVAAMAASLLNVSSRVLEELAKGNVEDVVVRGSDGVVALISVNPEAVLATMAKKNANLGLLIVTMKKARDKINKVLESL
ncbi:MAG: roadblock/LC7 domain-containing protein [Candidatus Njordarchaeia archaeon]